MRKRVVCVAAAVCMLLSQTEPLYILAQDGSADAAVQQTEELLAGPEAESAGQEELSQEPEQEPEQEAAVEPEQEPEQEAAVEPEQEAEQKAAVEPEQEAEQKAAVEPEQELEQEPEQEKSAAMQQYEEFLETYFPGMDTQEILAEIRRMDDKTRSRMIEAYEAVQRALEEEQKEDPEIESVMRAIVEEVTAIAEETKEAPVAYSLREGEVPESTTELRCLSGSGQAFIYYQFHETPKFETGKTYAFLDDIYTPDQALVKLGSGAVLSVTEKENRSLKYIQRWYGETAEVKCYVDVVKRGKGFDSCIIGGLYQVPDSGSPVEYRYFCGYGGAQNAGPLYAYTYETAELGFENVSAWLSDEGAGDPDNPENYILKLRWDGQEVTLDPGSYTVENYDEEKSQVTFLIGDEEGRTIRVCYECPRAVWYDGAAEGVENVPGIQSAWDGERLVLDPSAPTRAGYEFLNWMDASGERYEPGVEIAELKKNLNLKAQWKDVQKPEVSCQELEVMTGTSDEEVKAAIQERLTITDNEPVEECRVDIQMDADIAKRAGQKEVPVIVTDKAGNRTEIDGVVRVHAQPIQLGELKFTEETMELTAVLTEPGTDEITETGVVWGVMSRPTKALCNGSAKTESPVTEPGGEIRVKAEELQEGVVYQARAYAIAGGITYYSEEIGIGLDLPDYGTFSIAPGVVSGGTATFTISRTGKGEGGTQKVYYRTVNGSAVDGTHFTAKSGFVEFQDGETVNTVTVPVMTANTAYKNKTATKFTNADRVFWLEIYRVEGGAGLADDKKKGTCTLKAGSGYMVDKEIYDEKAQSRTMTESNKYVADRGDDNTDGAVYWINDRGKNTNEINFNTSRSLDINDYGTTVFNEYIKNTSDSYLYRYEMWAKDVDKKRDAWSHAWMGTSPPANAGTKTKCSGTYNDGAKPIELTDGNIGNDGRAIWTGVSDLSQDVEQMKSYPTVASTSARARDGYIVNYDGKTYAKLGFNQTTVYNYFGACGDNSDIWYISSFKDYIRIQDESEPQVLGIAPMAGGTYKTGDSFTVAVVFDEIVDSANSTGIKDVSLVTSWGTATYAGGANTNVLYFTGTVTSTASGKLTVSAINGAGNIKDLCSVDTTSTASKGGSAGGTVDTKAPEFTVTSEGVEAGTGTARVKVTGNTDRLQYAWTNSPSMPTTGWVEATAQEMEEAEKSSGLPLSIRKNPGEGTWYLHVIGTYNGTGATTYKQVVVDFGTPQEPAQGATPPELKLSYNDDKWEAKKEIQVTGTGGSVKYRESTEKKWTEVTGGSVTVTENGYYTFLLTAGDETIFKNVQITHIDQTPPSAVVGGLSAEGTEATKKEGVYTSVAFPVEAADSQSGVETLEYAWTHSEKTPESGWKEKDVSTKQLTYAADEETETEIYLHLRVTDQVGNVAEAVSKPWTVISRQAVATHVPDITLTGAPEDWTNDTATLEWKLKNHEGKKYTVTTSEGQTSTKEKGEFWVMDNGTYTVTVEDDEFGGTKTAEVTVDKIDKTAPEVTAEGISENWQSSPRNVKLRASDLQSGVGKFSYKITADKTAPPEDGMETAEGDSAEVIVGENGVWYIYHQSEDKAGEQSGEGDRRPANEAEGFLGPVKIDTTEPVLDWKETRVDGRDLILFLEAGYGPSGGTVKDEEKEIPALSAEAVTEGAENTTKAAEYRITEKGERTFTVTSRAGMTVQKSVTVYETELDPQNEKAPGRQLTLSGETLTEPVEPVKEGCIFQGWYTAKTGGEKWDFDTCEVTGDMTLYARWVDVQDPQITAQLENGEEGSYANQDQKILISYSDNEKIEKLEVKIEEGENASGSEEGPYDEVEGAQISVSQGEHHCTEGREGVYTYTFRATDDSGRVGYSKPLTVRVDKTKPALGELSYDNKAADIWGWIIGKESLIISVPVDERGSGAGEVTYVLTPYASDGIPAEEQAQEKTEKLSGSAGDQKAEIAVRADFKGTVKIFCDDAAGNRSDTVTIGTGKGDGVIVEDNAPQISILKKTGEEDGRVQTEELGDGWYHTAPELYVLVEDAKEDAVTAGLSSISWKINEEKWTEAGQDFSAAMTESGEFTLSLEAYKGETTVTVKAEDQAGNLSQKQVTVRISTPQETPEIKVDIGEECLENLTPDSEYIITAGGKTQIVVSDSEGRVPIDEDWLGEEVSIVKKGNGEDTLDSQPQAIGTLPERGKAPEGVTAVPEQNVGGNDGGMTGVDSAMEYRKEGGAWTEITGGTVSGLEPGTYEVRYKSDGEKIASESTVVVVEKRLPEELIGTVSMTGRLVYGETLTAVIEDLQPEGADYTWQWYRVTAEKEAAIKGADSMSYTLGAEDVGSRIKVAMSGRGNYAGTAETTSASAVEKAAQAAPENLAAAGETIAGKQDGSIFGVTAKMEYRKQGEEAYEAVDEKDLRGGALTGLAPGTFYFRYAEDEGHTPSAEVAVSVESGRLLKVTFTVDGKTYAVREGTYNSALAQIPEVPERAGYTGVWQDGTGTEADFTRLTADMDVHAVYTRIAVWKPVHPDQPEIPQNPQKTDRPAIPQNPQKRPDLQTKNGAENSGQPDNSAALQGNFRTQSVDAQMKDGEISLRGKAIVTGNVKSAKAESTVLNIGKGSISVTVESLDGKHMAGVADTAAVANTVLTEEEKRLVNEGEHIEIKVNVKDISGEVSSTDKKTVDKGLEQYEKELPALTLGAYIDISMFVKVGEGDWNTVTFTKDAIEVVVGIPENMQKEGREFYIIRAHDGEHTLLKDEDRSQDTITVKTDRFSAYAIAYQQESCGLCHICPTFLGICCFVWLAAVLLVTAAIVITAAARKKRKEI